MCVYREVNKSLKELYLHLVYFLIGELIKQSKPPCKIGGGGKPSQPPSFYSRFLYQYMLYMVRKVYQVKIIIKSRPPQNGHDSV